MYVLLVLLGEQRELMRAVDAAEADLGSEHTRLELTDVASAAFHRNRAEDVAAPW